MTPEVNKFRFFYGDHKSTTESWDTVRSARAKIEIPKASRGQGRRKAPPATQNASQKSSGDKNKEVRGDKVYLFVFAYTVVN